MPFGGKTLADQVAAMIDSHVRNEELNGSGCARRAEENQRLHSFEFAALRKYRRAPRELCLLKPQDGYA